MTREEYEELSAEASSLRLQLIEALEELSSRERELSDAHDSCLRHAGRLQALGDQVRGGVTAVPRVSSWLCCLLLGDP